MNELISFENFALQTSTPITKEILDLNEYSSQYGLVLSADEARELSDARNQSLKDNDRIEVGVGAVDGIIKRFSKSRYINQADYSAVLCEITEVFYYIKTETADALSDNDLLDELFMRFEIYCRGSVDLLISREAEIIIRKVNSGSSYASWYDDIDDADDGREAPENVVNQEYSEEETGIWYGDRDEPEGEYLPENDIEAELNSFDEFIDNLAIDDDIDKYVQAIEEDDSPISGFDFTYDDFKGGEKK